jgi:hypothetical protein
MFSVVLCLLVTFYVSSRIYVVNEAVRRKKGAFSKKSRYVCYKEIYILSLCKYFLCFYFSYHFSNRLVCLRHIKQMHERSISETDPRHPLLIVLLIIATKMCSEHDAGGFPGSFSLWPSQFYCNKNYHYVSMMSCVGFHLSSRTVIINAIHWLRSE